MRILIYFLDRFCYSLSKSDKLVRKYIPLLNLEYLTVIANNFFFKIIFFNSMFSFVSDSSLGKDAFRLKEVRELSFRIHFIGL